MGRLVQLASDAFDEASDTTLASHTPESGIATAWVDVESTTLNATVVGGAGYVRDNNGFSSNRYRAGITFTADGWDFVAAFTPVTSLTSIFWALIAGNLENADYRRDEFACDGSTAQIYGDDITSDSVSFTWNLSEEREMKWSRRGGASYFYIQDVLKFGPITHALQGPHVGIVLGNFQNNVDRIHCGSFVAYNYFDASRHLIRPV